MLRRGSGAIKAQQTTFHCGSSGIRATERQPKQFKKKKSKSKQKQDLGILLASPKPKTGFVYQKKFEEETSKERMMLGTPPCHSYSPLKVGEVKQGGRETGVIY